MTTSTVLIMSDEHTRKVMRALGNRHAHTPNLDALAARGTLFTDACCNSPICVPSRASFHTGRYTHQIGYWDNAMPYDGRVKGWAHALAAAGRTVTSIGKLHFRGAPGDDDGFGERILPLNVKDGIGDPSTLLRADPPPRPGTRQLAAMTGEGVTPYWDYDVAVADAAVDWLGQRRGDRGFTLFVSFVLPHFPLNAPARFRQLFDRDALQWPKALGTYTPETETLAAMRRLLDFQDHFPDEASVREAVAQYHALVAALDWNVGRVVDAIGEDTLVIYASDHGDNVGARGYWGKSTLWEESVGVPLVIAGPGIAAGRVSRTPVSLVDLHPTILEAAGLEPEPGLPGESLVALARQDNPGRPVFAEYHAVGSRTGMFMLRTGRFKLIEAVGDTPLLYDLAADPEEMRNLAADPAHAGALAACRAALRAIVDPEEASARAFADQRRRAEELGGEAAIRSLTPLAFTDPRAATAGRG